MCGIAGCFVSTPRGGCIATDVLRMTRALAHRGPDDEGFLTWRRDGGLFSCATAQTVAAAAAGRTPAQATEDQPWHVALGHRRFSIVDVSANGHQPFMDDRKRAALVFNGEIYNHVEIRRELESAGIVFHTRSDTEVLLHAYLHWGEAMWSRLNGMWAFALLDVRSGRLLLSRDRAGEKPLFYRRLADRFYFASEIKALFTVEDIHRTRRADDLRVWNFLYHGLRDHRPGSFFEGIEQLAPAAAMWIEPDGATSVSNYWNFPRQRLRPGDLSFDEAAAKTAELLGSSVALRLRSDVPLAAELSGGMDSASIVTLAAEHLRATAAPPLQTVTIRYPDPEFDEAPYARDVAQRNELPWTPITLGAQDYWAAADDMVRVQEQPYESPNQLGSRALWHWMKERGIRVVLNGGAGDELLAGYIGHHLLPWLTELALDGQWSRCCSEAACWRDTRYLNATILRRHLAMNLPGAAGRWYMRRMMRLPHFSTLHPVTGGTGAQLVEDGRMRNRLRLRDLLLTHSTFAPLPMYMVHGDKLSMSVPVELRVPFLDHRLIDFAFQLPVEHFFRAGLSKAPLRHALRNKLPPSILERREKMGFPVPLARWMREGEARIVADLRADGRMERFVAVERFCAQFASLDASLVWRIHQVATWMRLHDLH